ncbi:MAG TPA: GTP-binding protein [Pirellulales bacterium]|jgi:G3E family GTPase|nr:GTP-binding protein [Pirellulales bacterium]
MKRVRFLMLGGFLGAGKTTAMARLARHYARQGLKVGLVTNDQAMGLVDTQNLRAQGFEVGEVAGACFCCKFDDLIATAQQLGEHQQPDVLIAEPVGSCTDLAATVIEPLRQLYGDAYEIGPLAVLLKPEHGRKILSGEAGAGFSPKAAYIFLKQLEEADILIINKIDKLAPAEVQSLAGLVKSRFPDQEVLSASARDGTGFEELIAAIERPRPARTSTPEVDYDVYAEGEAELGWLNGSVRVQPGDPPIEFSLDSIVMRLVERLARALKGQAAEPAHLKILGESDGAWAIANLVSSASQVELSAASAAHVNAAELTINARAAIDPDELARLLDAELRELAAEFGVRAHVQRMQHFRPGRPVPTHRMPLGST